MQKLTGWTRKPFIGCDKCKEEGRVVCQATRYTIRRIKNVNGKGEDYKTTHYCQHHADIVDPPERRLARKKKKEESYARERANASDDSERDWYFVSGAHKYL